MLSRHTGSSRRVETSRRGKTSRHAEKRSARLVQPASFRVAVPTPSTARVVTAKDAGGRAVRPRDLLRVQEAVRQGFWEAHFLSRFLLRRTDATGSGMRTEPFTGYNPSRCRGWTGIGDVCSTDADAGGEEILFLKIFICMAQHVSCSYIYLFLLKVNSCLIFI